jgi:hypothetical protein
MALKAASPFPEQRAPLSCNRECKPVEPLTWAV